MKSVDRLMRQAVCEKVFPGGVLLASRSGKIRFFEAYGRANIFTGRAVTAQTAFDLASLTKPLATALAVMKLVEQGRIALGQGLGALLPELAATDKAGISLRELLCHRSGLPDYRPYYRQLRALARPERPAALLRLLATEALVSPVGSCTRYSDLGFMLLAEVVQRVSGRRLDRFVDAAVYRPLGLTDLFFVDLDAGIAPVTAPIAATEHCPWRKVLLEGAVHDDNAYIMGGIAGQAGLFGTAGAVHRLLDELVAVHAARRASTVFSSDSVRQLFARVPGCERTPGFDTPSATGSSSGRYFSENSVGHLGFTGTSFWVDLTCEAIVILLTNRVHPTRDNVALRAFRPVIHDAVMTAGPMKRGRQ